MGHIKMILTYSEVAGLINCLRNQSDIKFLDNMFNYRVLFETVRVILYESTYTLAW